MVVIKFLEILYLKLLKRMYYMLKSLKIPFNFIYNYLIYFYQYILERNITKINVILDGSCSD